LTFYTTYANIISVNKKNKKNMSEQIASPIESWNGPQLREVLKPVALHNEGVTLDSNASLYASEEIGLMSQSPDGTKNSVIGEVSLKNATDGVENAHFAVIKATKEDGTESFALGGLMTDDSGRKALNRSWLSLNNKEPITFGRAAENPENTDEHLVSAGKLWPGRSFTESSGFSRNHIHVALVDGKVEVRDTSKLGSEITLPNTDNTEMTEKAKKQEKASNTAAENVALQIESQDDWIEHRVDISGSSEPQPAQDDPEENSKNIDKKATNNQAVEDFLDLELFDDLRVAHDALVEGFGGQLLERSLKTKNIISGIAERIMHLDSLVTAYTAGELTGDFSGTPKRLIAELTEEVRSLEERAHMIALTEQDHSQVFESLQMVTEGLGKALPVIQESAEPENDWLGMFANTGNQFLGMLNVSRGRARYISDMAPNTSLNLMSAIDDISRLINSGNDSHSVKKQIRSNMEAMMIMLKPIKIELNELSHDSEAVQVLGHKFMKLVEEKKVA
jgi:hypothetical protein